MQNVERVRKQFDHRARNYDNAWTAWLGQQELKAVRTLVPQGSQVLDYGCGTGRTTLDLLQRGCQVTAFDVSEEMLQQAQEKARRRNLSAEFCKNIAELESRTWSIVTCIGVLDYYPDPVPLLNSLGRFTTPAGTLVVTFPNAYSPLGWFYFLGSRFTVPATPRTPRFIRLACQRAGLSVRNTLYCLPALPPIGYTIVLGLSSQGHLEPA